MRNRYAMQNRQSGGGIHHFPNASPDVCRSSVSSRAVFSGFEELPTTTVFLNLCFRQPSVTLFCGKRTGRMDPCRQFCAAMLPDFAFTPPLRIQTAVNLIPDLSRWSPHV